MGLQPSPIISRFLVGLWIIILLVVCYAILPSPSSSNNDKNIGNNKSSLRQQGVTEKPRCSILENASPLQLATLKELNLKACQLSRLPATIQHCTQLEKLDISDNPRLTALPDELRYCTRLQILFSSQNPGMTALPPVLGQMSSLTRLGWRSGALVSLEPASLLPPNLVHLILTDNQIQQLQNEAVWERLRHVRKLMLSHNQISSLSPQGIAHMRNLELLRLAGNQLTSLPDALWTLPKLTWLTISGNPGLGLPKLDQRVPTISLSDLDTTANDSSLVNLGAGASGSVTARTWQGRAVAVKTIHGVTSDGRAEDELQMYSAVGSAGMQHHVVGCLAVFHNSGGKSGVIMERIPTGVNGQPLEDLALPPTIHEVTVDRWEETSTRVYDASFIRTALRDAVDSLLYLHGTVGVAHGDFYAHNIRVDATCGHLYLLDLGASWATGLYAKQIEKLEVRAFGILVQDLLERQQDRHTSEGQKLVDKLTPLVAACLNDNVNSRPSFGEIFNTLQMIPSRSR